MFSITAYNMHYDIYSTIQAGDGTRLQQPLLLKDVRGCSLSPIITQWYSTFSLQNINKKTTMKVNSRDWYIFNNSVKFCWFNSTSYACTRYAFMALEREGFTFVPSYYRLSECYSSLLLRNAHFDYYICMLLFPLIKILVW